MAEALRAARTLPHRADFAGWVEVQGRNEHRLALVALKTLAERLGMRPGSKAITPAMERASSDFYQGFLRGFFDADGSVQGNQAKGVSVRLAQSDLPRLRAVQRMLLRLGIASDALPRSSCRRQPQPARMVAAAMPCTRPRPSMNWSSPGTTYCCSGI